MAGDKEDQIGDPSKVHVKGRQTSLQLISNMRDTVEQLSYLTACPCLSTVCTCELWLQGATHDCADKAVRVAQL